MWLWCLLRAKIFLFIAFRSPEELQNQPVVSTPLPSKPVEEQPYVRKLQKIDTQETAPKTGTIKKSTEETRGVKQKNITDSPTKNISKLLEVAKKEKKQKTDTFPSKGYVLNEPRPEPMEVDTGSGENVAQETPVTEAENEESLDEFVFVRKCEKYTVRSLNCCFS